MRVIQVGLVWALLGGGAWALQNHPTALVLDRIAATPVQYPLRFVFLADSRPNFDPEDPDADSIFRIAREQIHLLNPLFVIHGGDFVLHGQRAEYLHFLAQIDSFSVNLLTVRGNHELYADEGPWMYDSLFGPTDYAFDYGRYRFIVLADCQQNPGSGSWGHYIDYLITEEQLAWLDSLLWEAEIQGKWSFVFAHVPPYLPGHDTTYCLGYENYYPQPNYELSHTEEFTDLLAQYSVPLAFFGHQHFYDRHEYQGVWYIISGGAGSHLVYPPLSPPPYGCSCYHFLLMTVDSLGHLQVDFYPIGASAPDPVFSFQMDFTAVQEQQGWERSHRSAPVRVLQAGAPLRFPKAGTVYGLDGRQVRRFQAQEGIRLSGGLYLVQIPGEPIQRVLVLP